MHLTETDAIVSIAVTQPARQRNGRRVKRIVIAVVVLAGLLIGADFAAAAFAEHTVSQQAREQLGLTEDPAVTIHGFPFSTQAISGTYDHITISADGVPVQDLLRDVSIKANLHDVTAPLSELAAGNVDALTIGKLEGQVTLKDSDLARVPPLTKIEDLRIEPATESYVRNGDGSDDSDAAQDQEAVTEQPDRSTAGVRLSGKVRVAGEQMEIFAFAIIELDGNNIRITPHRLQFGNDQETTVVPQEVQQALLPNFEADINTGDLPFTVTPTAVRVDPGSITVKGQARNVRFSGASESAPEK